MRGSSRCWIEVDADALRHNAQVLRGMLPDGARMMAVVKAQAYGHGVDVVATALAGEVDAFGVACVEEAREVRRLADTHPILILGTCLPSEREPAVAEGFVPVISSVVEAQAYAACARGLGTRAVLHLAVDTGMGRIGVWEDQAERAAADLAGIEEVSVGYVSTHLPVADEDEAFTRMQLDRFAGIAARVRQALGGVTVVHTLNSAGILAFNHAGADMVRAGLALYGIAPIASYQGQLRQAMTWKTRVTLVREVGAGRGISYGRTYVTPQPMRIATLSAGYADGYQRHLSGKDASVLVKGVRCRVLGRVTMDQMMVDVSDVPGVAPGDEAVLCGRQGEEEILASELASRAGTIAWEIFTGASRIPR